MKPLTIEQLRNFEVCEWVWIDIVGEYGYIDGEPQTGYYQICHNGKASTGVDTEYITAVSLPPNGYNFDYSDYGTKWLAYKNKEMAEAKGEIVELPCMREVETVECSMKTTKYQVCFIRKDLPCMNAIDYYTTGIKSEAERRLAELTKK